MMTSIQIILVMILIVLNAQAVKQPHRRLLSAPLPDTIQFNAQLQIRTSVLKDVAFKCQLVDGLPGVRGLNVVLTYNKEILFITEDTMVQLTQGNTVGPSLADVVILSFPTIQTTLRLNCFNNGVTAKMFIDFISAKKREAKTRNQQQMMDEATRIETEKRDAEMRIEKERKNTEMRIEKERRDVIYTQRGEFVTIHGRQWFMVLNSNIVLYPSDLDYDEHMEAQVILLKDQNVVTTIDPETKEINEIRIYNPEDNNSFYGISHICANAERKEEIYQTLLRLSKPTYGGLGLPATMEGSGQGFNPAFADVADVNGQTLYLVTDVRETGILNCFKHRGDLKPIITIALRDVDISARKKREGEQMIVNYITIAPVRGALEIISNIQEERAEQLFNELNYLKRRVWGGIDEIHFPARVNDKRELMDVQLDKDGIRYMYSRIAGGAMSGFPDFLVEGSIPVRNAGDVKKFTNGIIQINTAHGQQVLHRGLL